MFDDVCPEDHRRFASSACDCGEMCLDGKLVAECWPARERLHLPLTAFDEPFASSAYLAAIQGENFEPWLRGAWATASPGATRRLREAYVLGLEIRAIIDHRLDNNLSSL